MRHIEEAKMLVNFFNLQAGTRFRLNTEEENRRATAIDDAIDRAKGNLESIKLHIKIYVESTPEDERNIRKCFELYIGKQEEEKDMSEVIPAQAVEVESREESVTKSLGILEHALMIAIREQSLPVIEHDIKEQCTKMLQDFIKNEYGTIERKVITVVDGEKKELLV